MSKETENQEVHLLTWLWSSVLQSQRKRLVSNLLKNFLSIVYNGLRSACIDFIYLIAINW